MKSSAAAPRWAASRYCDTETSWEPGERGGEGPGETALEQEDDEGHGEGEADEAAKEAVEPLPEEDELELLEAHPLVDEFVLGNLLVGLEIGHPLVFRQRRQGAGDRLPLDDGEA
jgi:hypothetical protein